MCKFSILYISFLLLSVPVIGQKVWVGDFNAAQLDSFANGQYPIVTGNVIVERINCGNLIFLKNIKQINGNLLIINNDSLTSLQGLDSLTYVAGKIIILKNKQLNNYCALQYQLLARGIKGVKLNNGIIDKFEASDNEYDPSLNQLLHQECEHMKLEFYFSI
jgi:hypothetical protein